MARNYNRLNLEDRRIIENGVKQNHEIAVIRFYMKNKVTAQAIHKEIMRNGGPHKYSAEEAQKNTEENKDRVHHHTTKDCLFEKINCIEKQLETLSDCVNMQIEILSDAINKLIERRNDT
mgnify:CR=1 FL=1